MAKTTKKAKKVHSVSSRGGKTALASKLVAYMTVRQVGNSLLVAIPVAMCRELGLVAGDWVRLVAEYETIEVTKKEYGVDIRRKGDND